MRYFSFLFIFIFALFFPAGIFAAENPLSTDNNPFGIHIINEGDLEDAANLVNSTGGDWGYVTLVVRRDERNIASMQRTLDKMRRLHLIPIIRIATLQDEENWVKPTNDDIDNWVYFLNSLNWVVKNRYIIIGNEPNHAKEWGGEVNPGEYAHYFYDFASKLKDASPDFFILPAGFDASAPTDKLHMEEEKYIREMVSAKPDVLNIIDGWSSHSYPNPGFSGNAEGEGKGSVRTYQWELDLLKELGITKELPVFITETGWIHDMENLSLRNKTIEQVGEELKTAYSKTWNDNRIVAITPFVLNYQTPPFDIFSWKKKDGTFYDFYYDIAKLQKREGKPKQEHKGEIIAVFTPEVIDHGETFYGLAFVKNTGQSIWHSGEVQLVESSGREIQIETPALFDIEPGQTGFILYSGLKTDNSDFSFSIQIEQNGIAISEPYYKHIAKHENSMHLAQKDSFLSRVYKLLSNAIASEILASF